MGIGYIEVSGQQDNCILSKKILLDYIADLKPSPTLKVIKKIESASPYVAKYKKYALEQAIQEMGKLYSRIEKATIYFEHNSNNEKLQGVYNEICTRYDYLSFIVSLID